LARRMDLTIVCRGSFLEALAPPEGCYAATGRAASSKSAI
jgi:hypothetical protein